MLRTLTTILSSTMLATTGGLAMAGCATPSEPDDTVDRLIIMSQSIGRGVPPETRNALTGIVTLLKDEGLAPTQQAWGLEGEKRVCVQLTRAQRTTVMPRIERLSTGIELLKVTLDENGSEPCP